MNAREQLSRQVKAELPIARLLGLSYPDEWEAFLFNNPQEAVELIVEALNDEGVLKVLWRMV